MAKKVSISGKSYIVNISYFCNSNCRFCYNFGGQNIEPKLSLEEIKKEIKKAKEKGYKIIALFGGEPTIHPNLFEILDFIKKNELFVRFETNGRIFFYPNFCKKIAKYKKIIFAFQISVHGLNSKIHDWATRTPKSFIQTIGGIINLKKYLPKIDIASFTVINKKNFNHLLEISRFLVEKLKIKFLNFSFIDVSGRALLNSSSLVKFSNIKPYLDRTLNYLEESEKQGKVLQFFIEKGPFCLLPRAYFQHYRFELELLAKNYIKHKACYACPFNENCDGFSLGYINLFGFDGLRLGGFTKEELKYFFSGVDLKNLSQNKKFIKFDEFCNPIFVPNKKLKNLLLNKLKEISKKAGVSLLLYKNKKIDVFDDPEIKIPKKILKFDPSISEKDLIESIRKRLNRDFKSNLTLENITLTTGGRHSLFLVFLLLLKPDNEIILQEPCWEGYDYGISNLGGKIRIIKKEVSIKEVKEKLNERTRAILITNPYLFDFSVLSQKTIKNLINLCNKHKIYLIVDEIVNRYLPRPISILEICNFEKDNVVVVNSFSKNYFIPFCWAGFLIAKKEIIKKAKIILDFSEFKITPQAVSISYKILNTPEEWRSKLAKKIYEKGRY